MDMKTEVLFHVFGQRSEGQNYQTHDHCRTGWIAKTCETVSKPTHEGMTSE
jgi:hypothetical protein